MQNNFVGTLRRVFKILFIISLAIPAISYLLLTGLKPGTGGEGFGWFLLSCFILGGGSAIVTGIVWGITAFIGRKK